MAEWEMLFANREPECHIELVESLCRLVALEPIPLEPDVQNGTIVLPEKL